MGSKLSVAYWEQNPDALLVLSPEGLVLEWNPAAELIFGYKQADMQGAGNGAPPQGWHAGPRQRVHQGGS